MPQNTPADESIYLAGNFQGWQQGMNKWILEKTDNGRFQYTFYPASGDLEFKFTRGGWDKVETRENGGNMPNRVHHYKGVADTLKVTISAWADLTEAVSTAADNVMIWSKDYHIPQLDRERRIWIYLPPDYNTSENRYPVLYMHDGQNVFDNTASYSGEWEVDETLNALFEEGDQGCIVVAIDNGGVDRMNEYSPWKNDQYGGGLGKE